MTIKEPVKIGNYNNWNVKKKKLNTYVLTIMYFIFIRRLWYKYVPIQYIIIKIKIYFHYSYNKV